MVRHWSLQNILPPWRVISFGWHINDPAWIQLKFGPKRWVVHWAKATSRRCDPYDTKFLSFLWHQVMDQLRPKLFNPSPKTLVKSEKKPSHIWGSSTCTMRDLKYLHTVLKHWKDKINGLKHQLWLRTGFWLELYRPTKTRIGSIFGWLLVFVGCSVSSNPLTFSMNFSKSWPRNIEPAWNLQCLEGVFGQTLSRTPQERLNF